MTALDTADTVSPAHQKCLTSIREVLSQLMALGEPMYEITQKFDAQQAALLNDFILGLLTSVLKAMKARNFVNSRGICGHCQNRRLLRKM